MLNHSLSAGGLNRDMELAPCFSVTWVVFLATASSALPFASFNVILFEAATRTPLHAEEWIERTEIREKT